MAFDRNLSKLTVLATFLAGVTITGALTLTGMTSGSVLFAGTSGVVSQDNASLFFDDTNNRLGIGTATPASSIETTGDILLANNKALKFKNAAGTALNILAVSAADNVTLSAPSGGDITVGASTSLIVKSAGAVGFGVASPGSKVDVFQTPTDATGLAADTQRLRLSGSTTANLARGIDFTYGGTLYAALTSNASTGKQILYSAQPGGYLSVESNVTTQALAALNVQNNVSFTGSSTAQTGIKGDFTINQTSTAAFDSLLLNRVDTAVGSGAQNFIKLTTSGTNRWRVDNAGNMVLSSAATSGTTLYNTADEVTNTERFRLAWVSNVLRMETIAAGSGSARGITIQSGGGANTTIAASNSTLTFNGSGYASYTGGITTGGTVMFNVTNGSTWSSTSAVQDAFSVTGTVNQTSGTGGWRGIVVNPTLTAVGSAGAKLIDLQVASTSKFYVDSSGNVTTTGGVTRPFTSTASTNYTALSTDDIIHLTSSSARTVNLPAAASSSGRVIVVKDAAGAALTGNITIDGNSSETIDGATTYTLNLNYQSATLYCNGTAWFVI